jgi:hypothetical protein
MACNPPQNLPKQLAWNGDRSDLERHVAGVTAIGRADPACFRVINSSVFADTPKTDR